MKMPFGKFSGVELDDVPNHYLRWLNDLADLRGPLKSAVQAEWTRRAGKRKDFSQSPEFHIGREDKKIARRIIESGRRTLAKTAHPDAGGSIAVMTRLNTVADTMLESLR